MKPVQRRMASSPSCLLVLDVEGTLFDSDVHLPGTEINSTIWQAIAKVLGEEAQQEEICTHRKWTNGEYASYLDWMRDTVDIHLRHGLQEDTFKELIQSASYNPGVEEAMTNLNRSRYEPVLITGGFLELARRAQIDFGINHVFAACEYYFNEHGELSSYNLLPCDFEGKIDFIELMLREYEMGSDQWIFIGDGKNDVPIARRAPKSVGFRPDPELETVVDESIDDFGQLLQVLDTEEQNSEW